MPRISLNDIALEVQQRGEGAETIVFSHSYLLDHRHFDAQIEALSADYRVIAFDHRDHGASGRANGPYDVYRLVDDAADLLEQLDVGPCHFVGLSTGGFVGMRLALRHRHLLRSLTLLDTSAETEPRLRRIKYRGMFMVLRLFGLKPLVGAAMDGLFGKTFLRDPARADERALWRSRLLENDPQALIRFGNAIFARDDVLDALRAVEGLPTMVVVGEEDVATPPSCAKRLAGAVPGARLEIIPNAGHTTTVEKPEVVTALIRDFLGSVA